MASFVRKPPPLALRLISGVIVESVGAPMVKLLDRSGRIERLMAKAWDKRAQEIVRLNPFRSYVPGSQDVFVATYAKSGTNWMMQIAHQLIWHGKAEFDHIHSVVPWPDAPLINPAMKDYAIPLDQATAWQNAPERLRVIKSHLNWDQLPYSEDARYISVIRDPKDVLVSAYHFIRGSALGRATPSVATMHRLFVSGKFFLGGSWAVNAAGYWAQRHRPNVLVMFYSTMKRDPEGTVRRVADFLDIRVSEDVIAEVCRKSSFEYMKSVDERFAPFAGAPWRKPPQMMRRGTQGASSELLTPEQQREIDESCSAELRALGSDLPYDELCGRISAPAASAEAASS